MNTETMNSQNRLKLKCKHEDESLENGKDVEECFNEISVKDILDTIPKECRKEARFSFETNGLVETLSTKVFPNWNEDQRREGIEGVLSGDEKNIYAKILIDLFNVQEHIQYSVNHKRFIEKTYRRFRKCLPNLGEESILKHDDSKFSFIEIVGYTDRWTWGKSSLLWEEALQHHYANNPHHPQFYQDKRMTRESLEESIVDMMACHWERKEGGGDEVPAEKIAGFSDFYLERYLPEDKLEVVALLEQIRNSGL